jgi:hypothetical protein
MKSIIFYTFIILSFDIHHVLSVNFCRDCKYHKLVRSNNNYNDISDLCTAYGKPLSDDYVFISKLCNAEVNVDIVKFEFMNCLDARISKDKCGISGLNFVDKYENSKSIPIVLQMDNPSHQDDESETRTEMTEYLDKIEGFLTSINKK